MSTIDDQIKTLQLKKKKIAFLKHILSSTKSYRDKELDAKASKEVIAALSKFVDDQIVIIETGNDIEPVDSNDPSRFSDAQTEILRKIATRALLKTPGEPKPVKQNNTPPSPQNRPDAAETPDKLSFALDNRHLAGKRVTVANDQNMRVLGEVVGLDAPNVIVKTDTGPTIQVPLSNISLA